jgi:hypothetical protein
MNIEHKEHLIDNAFPNYIWQNIPQEIINLFKELYPRYYTNNDESWKELEEYKNLPKMVKHHLDIRIEFYNDNMKN